MDILEKIFNSRTMSRALEQFGKLSFMDFFLFSLLGILLVTVIALLRRLFDKETKTSDILTGIVLSVYVSVILQLTLVCRADNSRIGIELDLFHGLLGPESAYHWLMMAYVVLNCMLFIPFGFILSLFSFVHERKIPVQFTLVTLISLITSLIIETAQLITGRGYYEIQDIVVNTLGGIIGWIVFRIIYCIINFVAGRLREK